MKKTKITSDKYENPSTRFLEKLGRIINPLSIEYIEGAKRILGALMVISTAPILYIFGFYHISYSEYFMGISLVLAGLVLTVSFFVIRLAKDTTRIFRLNLIIIGVLFLFLLLNASRNGTMSLWLYVYPLVTFFLMGKREGFLVNSVFLLFAALILIFHDFFPVSYHYTTAFKVRFIISLFLVILLAQMFEAINQRLQGEMLEKQEKLLEEKEKFSKARKEAEAANIAKSDFLANMSHELRTPLNHIIGFTELVVDKNFGELNDTQEEYLRDVLDSSTHLLSLINDILDLSKVEAGKLELEETDVTLRQLLENSIVMVKEKALKHGVSLKHELNGIPDIIRADERKLKQVVYNLLSNAAKFTPDGGEILLSARRMNGAESEIENGDYVEVSIRDTGIGLKREDLKRVFDPFEQVESSKSRKFQGTGLGLSLTRTLVELHGGKIWAESDGEGKGSVFRFTIPIVNEM